MNYSERPGTNTAKKENSQKSGKDRGLLEDVVTAAVTNSMQGSSSSNNNSGQMSSLLGMAAQAAQSAHNSSQASSQSHTASGNSHSAQSFGNTNTHQAQSFGTGGSQPSGKKSGGGLIKIIIFVVVAVLLVSCLMSSLSSYDYDTDTSTGSFTQTTSAPLTTSNASSLSTNIGGSFHQTTTTYEDTNYSSVDTTVASGVRDKFTTIKGDGTDTVTVLVYMCGTDLESNYGMGTNDLNEMVKATMSDQVHIIVESGGTQKWQNSVFSSSTNQYWEIGSGTVRQLGSDLGRKQMTDPQTLVDFIAFGTQNYPADRYMLIFWDHGGGSVSGYGYDQYYPNSTMTLDEIGEALEASGVKFDFVGFDACLMASEETAVAVAPYADYLIASEETEPGTGWYYTDWLSLLANNSSTPTVEVGKQIIDDFVTASLQNSSSDKVSLSIVDLAEFEAYVPTELEDLAEEITTAIENSEQTSISNARKVTKEFASSSKIDQIDLIHFCKNLGTTEANELAEVIQSCVKYNRTANMSNAYGMSIFFPYYSTSYTNTALQIYDKIGVSSAYTKAVRTFATMGAAGQTANNYYSSSIFDLLGSSSSSSSSGTGSSYDMTDLLSLFMGGSSSSSSSGSSYSNSGYATGSVSLSDLLGGSSAVDTDTLDLLSQLIGRDHLDNSNLKYTELDGQQVLVLDQEQWDLVQSIGLNVWVDDGTGYIDLGIDDVFDFDDEGNLIAEYDGLWVSVNDQPAAYYVTYEEFRDDGSYTVNGYILAQLNGEMVRLIVEFTDEEIDGVILGAQRIYDEGVEAKGYIEITEGDEIDLVCDFYDYDGNFQAQHKMGETITVDGEGLVMGTYEVVGQRMLYGYRLTDIYNANHWTPMSEYTGE